MPARPPLPEIYEIPTEVDSWSYNSESGKNAHVWQGSEYSVAVFFYRGQEEVEVAVFDQRVSGFDTRHVVDRSEFDVPDDVLPPTDAERKAVVEAIDTAVTWMQSTEPEQWSHPSVPESIFRTPTGYEFEAAYLEDRERVIYYRREGYDPEEIELLRREPKKHAREHRPYIYVHEWTGSGNVTVALAPWLNCHGPGSRHLEIAEVESPPEEAGLEVGLLMARDWAREQAGECPSPKQACGQTSLAAWRKS
jgi:hypothetical protein